MPNIHIVVNYCRAIYLLFTIYTNLINTGYAQNPNRRLFDSLILNKYPCTYIPGFGLLDPYGTWMGQGHTQPHLANGDDHNLITQKTHTLILHTLQFQVQHMYFTCINIKH